MRTPVSTFVGTAFALGAGCITTEAFLRPPAVGSFQQTGVDAITSAAAASAPVTRKSCHEVLRPNAARCPRSRSSALRPSAQGRGSAGGDEVGGEGTAKPGSRKQQQQQQRQQQQQQQQPQQASSGRRSGGGGGERLFRYLTQSAAAAATATAHLRQAAATTLAAVLLVASSASTEQDIMTAMMGLDPSLATAGSPGAPQSAMTLPKDGQAAGKSSSEPKQLGSIDLTGQSTGAGEIPGSTGGGFKDGRLMLDVDSDLATMLGRKMKTPDAEPLTH
eukprot:g3214.t1